MFSPIAELLFSAYRIRTTQNSFVRSDEGLINACNVSFRNSLHWPINIIILDDKTHRRSTTISLNVPPYLSVWSIFGPVSLRLPACRSSYSDLGLCGYSVFQNQGLVTAPTSSNPSFALHTSTNVKTMETAFL